MNRVLFGTLCKMAISEVGRMNRVLVLAGLVWSFSLVVGCSSSKSPTAAGAGASNASGAAGSASGGAAGQSSTPTAGSAGMKGPVITSAPAAWARPADCGGIGDLCPNLFGCKAGQSTCQLEGNVCIPAFPAGATSLPGRTISITPAKPPSVAE